jgi:CheY-like chemotaxis protein
MTTVLLVEDDANILRALETIIALDGYVVRTAPNGAKALHQAQLERPDIVVSDCMMPVMDGPSLFRAMKTDVELADVPIVLTSAVVSPPAGVVADAFLRKPFAAAQLLDLIHRLAQHEGSKAR